MLIHWNGPRGMLSVNPKQWSKAVNNIDQALEFKDTLHVSKTLDFLISLILLIVMLHTSFM